MSSVRVVALVGVLYSNVADGPLFGGGSTVPGRPFRGSSLVLLAIPPSGLYAGECHVCLYFVGGAWAYHMGQVDSARASEAVQE